MWVRILTEGDYPGLSGWALNASTCILRRGTQKEVWPRPGGGGSMKIEAGTAVMWPPAKEGQRLPEAGRGKYLILPRRECGLANNLILAEWCWLGLMASRTVREYISVVLNLSVCANLSYQPQESGSVVKNPPANCRRCRRHGFNPWVRTIPWSTKWQPSILAWTIPSTEEPGSL